ncbi:MAG: hypothetical protein QNL77_09475 [Akkermansiaceae bacterium]
MDDPKEGLIRHELDHTHHQKKPKKDAHPGLPTLKIQRNPAENIVLHIRRRHQEDDRHPEPLLQVMLQLLLDLRSPEFVLQKKTENRNGNQPNHDPGDRLEDRT